MNRKKVILLIRDGWGFRESKEDNAIYSAETPYTDSLMKKYPNVLIDTCGESVGLPSGYQGNSEVGHSTIGSGRVLFQPLARINKSIKTGEFFENPAFISAIENCKKNNSSLHIIGLIQTEGVHSHIEHLFALLDLCKKLDFHDVFIHAITDGRDSPVTDSEKNIGLLNNKIAGIGFGKIATISGRYYTMDRDKRWERTKKAYDCIVSGVAEEYSDALSEIKKCHSNNETDEFIVPRKIKDYKGIKDGDSVIFFNFRTDRTRQLTQAIIEKEFSGWERKPLNVNFVAMTQFYTPMNASVAFPEQSSANLLGEVISENGLKQLRISETEKYAHVTFFFNSQIEKPYENEERILVESPKVATYDLQPEMSVYSLAERIVEEINKNEFDFIVANLVNCDMVGHTGNSEAIRKAVKSVDECTGKICEAGLKNDYILFIFADHGNAEDQTDLWRTSHTLNKVPFIVVGNGIENLKLREDGGLKDIAPSVLDLMKIEIPLEMSGESLILN